MVRHFREAGNLTRDFGSVVLLEDDLTVAPPFYDFASQVLQAYGDDGCIGGFCLYGLWLNGFTLEPFTPIEDGNDVFFLRVPHTQGLCFSAKQWTGFEEWSRTGQVREHPALHPAFLRFATDEWFPSLASYLAETGRFFCFPRVSHTVGWGDAGAHFDSGTAWFQTPIQLGQRDYRLLPLDEAAAAYDGFFELLPDRLQRIAPALQGLDFDVDLNATKRPTNLRSDHVLTTRPVRNAVMRFGLEMYPRRSTPSWQYPAPRSPLLTVGTWNGKLGPRRKRGAACTPTPGAASGRAGVGHFASPRHALPGRCVLGCKDGAGIRNVDYAEFAADPYGPR